MVSARQTGCSSEISLDPHGDVLAFGGEDLQPDTLAQSYKRLGSIYGLAHTLLSETCLASLLDGVVRILCENLSADRCLIGKVTRSGDIVTLRARNVSFADEQTTWPVSTTVISRVVASGRAILSADAIGDKRFDEAISVNVQQIRSVVCVPLGSPNACDGFIYLDNRYESGCFTDVDLYFVTALSHFIQLALKNAERLEAIREVQALSDSRWSALQEEIFREHRIIGRSEKLLRAYDKLRRAAQKDVPLLVYGETGTGKDLFAKAAHQLSPRRERPFMSVNVAALSETLVESELFGHVKGAFTGAVTDKAGRLELADGGTLFLDEVAEIPLQIQATLLRVLESGELERVGSSTPKRISVRLVCATHRRLELLVENDTFREDLYWRLTGVTIELPPLRERPEDIPDLIEYFLTQLHSRKKFSPEAIGVLQRYGWPGNVRQLSRLVAEQDAVCESDWIRVDDLPPHMSHGAAGKSAQGQADTFVPLDLAVEELERNLFAKALNAAEGNHERAMKLLGISRSKYFERKKRFSI